MPHALDEVGEGTAAQEEYTALVAATAVQLGMEHETALLAKYSLANVFKDNGNIVAATDLLHEVAATIEAVDQRQGEATCRIVGRTDLRMT